MNEEFDQERQPSGEEPRQSQPSMNLPASQSQSPGQPQMQAPQSMFSQSYVQAQPERSTQPLPASNIGQESTQTPPAQPTAAFSGQQATFSGQQAAFSAQQATLGNENISFDSTSENIQAATEGAKKTKKTRPGWSAVIAASIVAALVGGGIGYGAVYADFGKARPAAVSSTHTGGSTAVVKQAANNAPDWQAVHRAVSPAVVAITNSSQEGSSAGSGVIIDKDGHIITNNHVISGAEQLLISLADGRVFKAKLVGTDPATDLAVIKLVEPPKDLAFAQIGDSSQVKVGQAVAAIGNPLGLEATMTTGIISALDRPVTTRGENADPFATRQATPVVTNAIQIDAAVNPGNSGGPVFDSEGRVVGIASSIASIGQLRGRQAGSIGLGFAIPVNLAKNVADQLIKNGVAEHAFFGVTISDGVAQFNGQARIGAQVQSVTPGTPAAKAGIRPGDVITKIDGHNVSGGTSLTGYVRQYKSGDVVTVTFDRDGKLLDVDATLVTRPDAK